MMKKLALFAAVAALSIPAQSFAAHHSRHHGAWKSHHGARHSMHHRSMSSSSGMTTEALNARSAELARGTVVTPVVTAPTAPAATPTMPVAPTATVTTPTMPVVPTATVTQPTVNGAMVTTPAATVVR